MEIIWLPLAEDALDNIFYFYAENNVSAARKIIANIKREVECLSLFPEMAAKELLLEDYPQNFRSLVIKHHHKAVYFIENNTIYIADVWDCRQNPDDLQNRIITN